MDSDEKIDLVVLWRTIWIHKYLVAICTCLFGIAAVFLAFSAIPTYRAEASVNEVNRGSSGAASLVGQLGGLASLVGVNLGAGVGGSGAEAKALLKSRRLVEEFITRNNLIPIIFPHPKKPPTLWMAVKRFREDLLSIRDDKTSGLTIVSISWVDPVVAARWVNDFISLANELMRVRAITESKASIQYLNEQILLTNVVELQRVMYSLIENETKTLMLANARAEYAFSVVDAAVPPEVRISPRRMLMTALGLALGTLVGISLAFAHDLWRQRKAALM